MLLISAAVIGINSMLGMFLGNESFRNEIASPLLGWNPDCVLQSLPSVLSLALSNLFSSSLCY